MRSTWGTGVAIAAGLLAIAAPHAHADPTAATAVASGSAHTSGEPPSFSALPSFVSHLPSQIKIPSRIPAGQHVSGVYARPREMPSKLGKVRRAVDVFESQQVADLSATAAGTISTGVRGGNTCFRVGMPSGGADEPVVWNELVAQSAFIFPMPRKGGSDDGAAPQMVHALLLHKVVGRDATSIDVERRQVLLDADTLGAQGVAEERSRFAFFQSLPGGIQVYAQRDNDQIRFAVVPAATAGSGFVGLTSQTVSLSTTEQCPLIFELPARPGATPTVILHAEVSTGMRVGGDGVQAPVLRGVLGQFSTSFLTADAEPAIALSYRFIGRERLGDPVPTTAP